MSTPSAVISTVKPGSNVLSNRRQQAGLFFVMPAVLFVLVFFIVPLIMTFWMSLNNWPLLGKHFFIGLDNYVKLASDKQFWNSLWFTTKYTALVTPFIFVFAFILALMVDQPLRGVGFFRTAYFLPVVIGLGTSSLLWVWLLNDRVGIINGVLMDLGMISKPVIWLGDKNLAMFSIMLSVVWKTVGFTMILDRKSTRLNSSH